MGPMDAIFGSGKFTAKLPEKLAQDKFPYFKHRWEHWELNFGHKLIQTAPRHNRDKFYNFYVYSAWEEGMALELLLARFYANPNYRPYTVGLDLMVRKSLMEMPGPS